MTEPIEEEFLEAIEMIRKIHAGGAEVKRSLESTQGPPRPATPGGGFIWIPGGSGQAPETDELARQIRDYNNSHRD